MVPLVNDSMHEFLESFSVAVALSCNHSWVLLGQSLATVLIADDDSKWLSYVLQFTFSVVGHVVSTLSFATVVMNLFVHLDPVPMLFTQTHYRMRLPLRQSNELCSTHTDSVRRWQMPTVRLNIWMYIYIYTSTCLYIPYKLRVVMSQNSLSLGTCRESRLIIPSPCPAIATNQSS